MPSSPPTTPPSLGLMMTNSYLSSLGCFSCSAEDQAQGLTHTKQWSGNELQASACSSSKHLRILLQEREYTPSWPGSSTCLKYRLQSCLCIELLPGKVSIKKSPPRAGLLIYFKCYIPCVFGNLLGGGGHGSLWSAACLSFQISHRTHLQLFSASVDH